MRGIGVTLVLLFLTGSQARHFWQQDEPPPSPMERLKEEFQKYMESARTSAREVVAQMDASNFGQHFGLDLATKLELLVATAEQLQEQLAPSYQAIRERVHADYQELTADLVPIRAKLMPLYNDLQTKLHEAGEAYYAKLKPLVQEWKQSAHQDLEQLKSKVEPLAAEARDKLRLLVSDFRQKAAPYMDEVHQVMRQKVQQVQERARPRMQEMQAMLQEYASNLRMTMVPMFQRIVQYVEPGMKKCQEHVMSLLTTVQRNLEYQGPQQS